MASRLLQPSNGFASLVNSDFTFTLSVIPLGMAAENAEMLFMLHAFVYVPVWPAPLSTVIVRVPF